MTDTVPFVSNERDFNNHLSVLRFAGSHKSEARAVEIIASTMLANFAWLSEIYGPDDATRILKEALEAVDTRTNNYLAGPDEQETNR